MKITVIAAGSWGTALSIVLSENGHDVKVWARSNTQVEAIQKTRRNEKYLPGIVIPENIEFTTDKAYAIQDAEVVLFSVPSQQYKETLEDFAAHGLIK